MLIMNRRCRTGEVINFVDFDVQRKGYVVPNELEARVVVQMIDVSLRSGEQVVYAQNLVAVLEETIAKMRAQETRPTCDQKSLSAVVVSHPLSLKSALRLQICAGAQCE